MSNKDTVLIGAGNPGLAMGKAMSLLLAARSAKRRQPRVLTVEETAEQKARAERTKWNAEVEARKAKKKAAKATGK